MSELSNKSNLYSFSRLLKKDEKSFQLLYTQMLNGRRILEHNVVYVFDEVGCGKTVSAIIAMAAVISKKRENDEDTSVKILVMTPKSVCAQFTAEIQQKLNVGDIKIFNISGNSDKEIAKTLENENMIVVSNPQKAAKLKDKKWDLIIIDEAHDIVCNNKKQTEVFFAGNSKEKGRNKIEVAYDEYTKKVENLNCTVEREKLLQDRKEKCERVIESCVEDIENGKQLNPFTIDFIKYLVIEEYNQIVAGNAFQDGRVKIPLSRFSETNIFASMCSLNANKVMFLTATPYKNSRDIDFLNYALMASKIVTNYLFSFQCLPQLDWVQNFYTGNIHTEGKEKSSAFMDMESANTSLMFKEIAQAIPFEQNSPSQAPVGKERKVEVWREGKIPVGDRENGGLKDKIFDVLLDDNGQKKNNRIIIFVSNSKEGKYVFDKIFPDSGNYDITQNGHSYMSAESVTCKFIMNKFRNAHLLRSISEGKDVPDILIASWQVAQVGVNLPQYNYVVNYHIPSVPGYLEQRYGRIDRLNSINDTLYNVYYIEDNERTSVYYLNLIDALQQYKNTILTTPHNLPVKNLLLCNGLHIGGFDETYINKHYCSLALYLLYYRIYIQKTSDDDLQNIRELLDDELRNMLKGTKWGTNEKQTDEASGMTPQISIKSGDQEGKVAITINSYTKIFDLRESPYADDECQDNDYQENIQNEDRECEEIERNIRKFIKEICEQIKNFETYNEKIEMLNKNDNLGNAGSIIFWYEEKNRVTIQSQDIVEAIVKERNKPSCENTE